MNKWITLINTVFTFDGLYLQTEGEQKLIQ